MRRFLSTASALPRGVPETAFVRLPRSLLAVTGNDSAKFLNGLLTTRPPDHAEASRRGCYSAMLNAKGRVVIDTFIYAAQNSFGHNGGYLIEVDNPAVERVVKTLRVHKLLSDVDISLVRDVGVWAAWDDSEEQEHIAKNIKQEDSSLLIPDTRAPGMGYRMLIPDQNAPDESIQSPLNTYMLRRYLFGIPEGTNELLPDKALPLDYCLDYMGGIEFDKGCYIGQELTIRTHHHGTVRKRVSPVAFSREGETIPEEIYAPKVYETIEPGVDIQDASPVPNAETVAQSYPQNPFGASSSRRRPRPAGEIVAALGNVGLAKMRVDKLGHEFHVGDVKVSAFTPFWWPESRVI